MALQPVVLDRYVLAFDVTGVVEAFTECGRLTREGISPTTGIAGCCAWPASGQARIMPPSATLNSRRLTSFPSRQAPHHLIPRRLNDSCVLHHSKFHRRCPILVIRAVPACPVRPKSGHSAVARVYGYTPYSFATYLRSSASNWSFCTKRCRSEKSITKFSASPICPRRRSSPKAACMPLSADCSATLA